MRAKVTECALAARPTGIRLTKFKANKTDKDKTPANCATEECIWVAAEGLTLPPSSLLVVQVVRWLRYLFVVCPCLTGWLLVPDCLSHIVCPCLTGWLLLPDCLSVLVWLVDSWFLTACICLLSVLVWLVDSWFLTACLLLTPCLAAICIPESRRGGGGRGRGTPDGIPHHQRWEGGGGVGWRGGRGEGVPPQQFVRRGIVE